MDQKEFGKTIKAIRKEQRMTQRQLAEKIDATSSHICKIEKGYSYPSIGMLKQIADALNVKLDDILPMTELNEVDRFLPYLKKAEDWQIKAVETILKIKK